MKTLTNKKLGLICFLCQLSFPSPLITFLVGACMYAHCNELYFERFDQRVGNPTLCF